MSIDLLRELRDLEVELHQPSVRSSVERLGTLLHDSFTEFGRSGRSYCKADILISLPMETSLQSVWSQDFALVHVVDNTVLLTYKSAQIDGNGGISRHTLRSSLWLRGKHGWQMRFHQGTPTKSFEITDSK